MSEIKETLGKYGLMRLQYIKQEKPTFYYLMLQSGELQQHLEYIDGQASAEVDRVLSELIVSNQLPDKQSESENWVKVMNILKHQAEEVVIKKLICV